MSSSPDDRLIVFPDTNALLAMLCFPIDAEGRPTLAGEVKALYEVHDAHAYVVDSDDAPIFAAAVLSEPDVVLSNDFETFHTDRAKRFWAEHGIRVESLYGLLCLFGRRERPESQNADAD